MILYNSNKNAYCRAINAETFETIEDNPVWISTLINTRNPYFYSHFEISICIYSVSGEIDQMSTNTSRYTTCCAANVYILCLHIDWKPYSTFQDVKVLHNDCSRFPQQTVSMVYVTSYEKPSAMKMNC